jgi:hypothetical protein
MTFGGKCIVVQLEDRGRYVCVPAVAPDGAFAAVAGPLGRPEAFRGCNHLNELEPADYSDLTRKAIQKDRIAVHHI